MDSLTLSHTIPLGAVQDKLVLVWSLEDQMTNLMSASNDPMTNQVTSRLLFSTSASEVDSFEEVAEIVEPSPRVLWFIRGAEASGSQA